MNVSQFIEIRNRAGVLSVAALLTALSGCAQTPLPADLAAAAASGGDADQFLVVDCFLPGQLRRLGKRAVYQSARRVAKLPASDCEIRGGEYVAYDRADYRSALKVWLPNAEAGDALAQTYVGEIYERGMGTEPDYRAAFSWYQKAALQGNQRAQNNLGQLYELGRGVARDQVQALNWYRKASGLSADQLAFSSSISALQREASEARAEAASLRGQLDAAQRRQSEQQRSLQQSRRQLDQARSTLQRARQDRAASTTAATVSIKPVDPTLARLEADVASARAELLRANQSKARAEQSAELLKARLGGAEQDKSELLARIERLQQQTEQSRETQRQEVERLQAERERLRAAEERLAATARELRQQQARLAARDDASVAQLEQKVSGLEQELGRKQRLIEQLEREMIDGAADAASADDQRLREQRANLDRTATQLDDAQRALQQYQQVLDAQRSDEIDALKQQLRLQREVIDDQRRRNSEVEQELLTLNQTLAETVGRADALAQQKQSLQRRGGDTADSAIETETLPGLDFGGYYALVIGNNRYSEFPNLVTAVNDAKDVATLLRQRYGFEVELLTNVNRYQMLEALNRYRARLTDRDNFLLYYAGHGELDRVNQNGNWLPVDAQPDSTTNWITNGDITNIINTMNAKHVMVIADSCYSGTLTRSVTTSIDGARSPQQQKRWLELMIKTRSRTVLTSGGLKPVLDGGGGRNSVFAKNLLRVLRDNDGVLEGPILYRSVAGQVKRDAAELGVEQTPEYSPIHYAGDLGAPFLFAARR